jgi:hypothetical protein
LKGLLELVVKKEPALIPTFLPDVLALQVDPAGAVRKLLPDWVDGAVHALPTAEVLLAALQCLAGLLHDTVPAVAKRAVLSSYATFRAALALVEVHGAEPSRLAELQAAWQAAQALKGAVAGLVATSGDTHATVRLAAVKSVEQTVMLLTADAVPAVAGLLAAPRPLGASNQVITKAALVRDAEKLLSQLLGVLSASLGEDAASPLGPACIKAAAGVAQQRPQFLGRIVPPLLALAKSGNFKVGFWEYVGIPTRVGGQLLSDDQTRPARLSAAAALVFVPCRRSTRAALPRTWPPRFKQRLRSCWIRAIPWQRRGAKRWRAVWPAWAWRLPRSPQRECSEVLAPLVPPRGIDLWALKIHMLFRASAAPPSVNPQSRRPRPQRSAPERRPPPEASAPPPPHRTLRRAATAVPRGWRRPSLLRAPRPFPGWTPL